MADEYFFALTLTGKNNEVWDPEAKGAEDYQGGHKLIIKQALLGPEAAEGEVNVVQVEAMTWKDSVKIPVATLKAGSPNNQVLLDLSFPDPPVTFSLIQGNGPLHLIGHHLIGSPMEEFDELEEEMMDDEEEEEGADSEMTIIAAGEAKDEMSEISTQSEEGGNTNRKRKLSNGKLKEEEDEEEEPKAKKAKTATNSKGKTPVKNNAKAAAKK